MISPTLLDKTVAPNISNPKTNVNQKAVKKTP
jgi:hypothetical protein